MFQFPRAPSSLARSRPLFTVSVRRVACWAAVVIVVFVAPAALHAAALNIPGQATVGGPTVTIGTLSPAVTGAGAESADFVLDPAYRWVMNDAANRQFRFFQVIYYDDEPVKWGGNIITAAGTAAHTGDVVDVPKGGWDYESTTGNNGGDDNSPFYESDTANNPSTGNPYRFPGLSYPSLHTADGTNPGKSSTNDGPGLGAASHKTLFETFIAYEDTTFLTAKKIDVLGGYDWGVQTDAGNVKSGIAPTNIAYTGINAAMLTELQGALNRSGFNDWTIIANDVIIPEPATAGLAAMVVSIVGMRRRR